MDYDFSIDGTQEDFGNVHFAVQFLDLSRFVKHEMKKGNVKFFCFLSLNVGDIEILCA